MEGMTTSPQLRESPETAKVHSEALFCWAAVGTKDAHASSAVRAADGMIFIVTSGTDGKIYYESNVKSNCRPAHAQLATRAQPRARHAVRSVKKQGKSRG